MTTIMIGDNWADDDGNLIEVQFDGKVVTGKKFTPVPFFELMEYRTRRRISMIWP